MLMSGAPYNVVERRKVKAAQDVAIYLLYQACPFEKVPCFIEERLPKRSRQFKEPIVDLCFAVLTQAVKDIGFYERWLRGFEKTRFDTREAFADGELNYLAEQIGIEPDYMSMVLKITGLIDADH